MNPEPRTSNPISVVIPARLESSRLPQKVLADLGGRPILQHVWEQVNEMEFTDEVFIATDSETIQSAANDWGAEVIMTSPDCQSGTERIASIIEKLKGEFILNAQGDEPFIDPALLDKMVSRWKETNCDIVTPVTKINSQKELFDPNQVKAVLDHNGKAIYFSRSAIPYDRNHDETEWHKKQNYWGHIGVYGYTRKVLEDYPSIPESPLEKIEKLEQLRFIDAGYTIHTIETQKHSIGIDTPDDLEAARKLISKQKNLD